MQEKQQMKVKEKFDKCNKEKLLEFCDVLDIPVAKATTRKVCCFSIAYVLFIDEINCTFTRNGFSAYSRRFQIKVFFVTKKSI